MNCLIHKLHSEPFKRLPHFLIILTISLFIILLSFVWPAFAANDNSTFSAQSVPSMIVAGTQTQVSVTFTNSGSTTWTKTGGYYLSSVNPINNNSWGPSRIDLDTSDSIAPNSSKTFVFNISAPKAPGNYNFQWQMGNENGPFGGVSQNVSIVIGVPSANSDSINALSVDPGQGTWSYDSGGKLNVASSSSATTAISFGPTGFTKGPNLTVEMDVATTDTNGFVGFHFERADGANGYNYHYGVFLYQYQVQLHRMGLNQTYSIGSIDGSGVGIVRGTTSHHIKLVQIGQNIQVFVDGHLFINDWDTNNLTYSSFGRIAPRCSNTGCSYDGIKAQTTAPEWTLQQLLKNPNPGSDVDEFLARAISGNNLFASSNRSQEPLTAFGYDYQLSNGVLQSQLNPFSGKAQFGIAFSPSDGSGGTIYSAGQAYYYDTPSSSTHMRSNVTVWNLANNNFQNIEMNAVGKKTDNRNEIVSVLDDGDHLLAGESAGGPDPNGDSNFPNGGGLWWIPKATIFDPSTWNRIYEISLSQTPRNWHDIIKRGNTYFAMLNGGGQFQLMSSTNLTSWITEWSEPYIPSQAGRTNLFLDSNGNLAIVHARAANGGNSLWVSVFDGTSWVHHQTAIPPIFQYGQTGGDTGSVLDNQGKIIVIRGRNQTWNQAPTYTDIYRIDPTDWSYQTLFTNITGWPMHLKHVPTSGPNIYFGTSYPGYLYNLIHNTVVDTVPPAISSVQPSGTNNTNSPVVSVNYSDQSPSSGLNTATVIVTLDGVSLTNCTATSANVSCPTSNLSFGTHSIGGSVADNAGNTSPINGSFSVSALDTGLTSLISSDYTGAIGNSTNYYDLSQPVISGNNQFTVFCSQASNLVPQDTNNFADVFMKDNNTGQTTIVSTDANGNQGNNASERTSVSSDGHFVAFESWANNLVPGDTNGHKDIFVKDTQTGAITMVSTDSSGNQGDNDSSRPSISQDGRYVAFISLASNLVPGDTNNTADIFVKDTQTGTTSRISTDSNGNQSNNQSDYPSISADGKYVAFRSIATNLVPGDTSTNWQIFLKNTQTGAVTCLSQINGVYGNGSSGWPSISADGNFVAFPSYASNLVSGDTNNERDIFRANTQTGEIVRVDTDSAGNQVTGYCSGPVISSDGRYVAFGSYANNLVSNVTNNTSNIYRKDLQTGNILLCSISTVGQQANGASDFSAISSDGSHVVFLSAANNLVPGDNNGTWDVFMASN